MPKVDVSTVPRRLDVGYPEPFAAATAGRVRQRLRAGACAAFPKGSGDGHHMINRSDAVAVYLETGTRDPADLTTCSDIDIMSANADGRFTHKDGSLYPDG